MAIQKKHGKGRLDKWYRLAKEKGYRARAAFKLIQLNKKYHFLEKSKVLIDLCAAPGSWCQVAAEVAPSNALIIGVDLAPIKPIPRCITFQSDITTDKCRATIRQHLKSWKADTVLHDGAPNVGTAWVQDAYSQAELVLQSLKLATDFLVAGGTFVTKVFRSKDYNSLLWVFNQLFATVEATKPPSSRSVSAEIFVVCQGYKAPKRIDPNFLDPRSVFAELSDPAPNNEAKVFNPEKKKRKREGYEEGDWTQFKEAPASEFIQTSDPVAMLGTLNKLSFTQPPNGDIALATLDRLPETNQEIRECCADLKVLGRKEFKKLLHWRLKVRAAFGFGSHKDVEQEEKDGEEVAEIDSMDEELKIQEELQGMRDRDDAKKKRERRRLNEKKQKQIVRMQLGMTTPMELGMEQTGPRGEDAMFALKTAEKFGPIPRILDSKMYTIDDRITPKDSEEEGESVEDDSDGDALERELDAMYEQYTDRRAAYDAKYRAKRRREEHGDGEWNGFSDRNTEESSGDDDVFDDGASIESSDEESVVPPKLLTDLQGAGAANSQLSRRATMFFDQEIFKGIDNKDEDSGIDLESEDTEYPDRILPVLQPAKSTETSNGMNNKTEAGSGDHSDLVVKPPSEDDWGESRSKEPTKNGRPDVDIITAEAMTLAHQLATRTKSKADLVDEGFNKWALRDTDGLPEWFLDDENKHSKPVRPITKAAAAAIKEKLRALNARPIKKVREAKARKKFKAAQRLEKLRKKSALLLEDESMSEGDKAKSIAKLLAKAAKKKPKRQVKLVVAKGSNKGISGRPRGMKGKYKMVDARLKKDIRAQKRLVKRS